MANTKKSKILIIIVSVILALALGLTMFFLRYYPNYVQQREVFDIRQSPLNNGDLTVVSFNIRYYNLNTDKNERHWFNRAHQVAQTVASHEPDIAGFQEVKRVQTAYLASVLEGYDYVNAYRSLIISAEGCPIFFRTDKYELLDDGMFWLSETPEKRGRGWDAAHNRIAVWAVLREKATDRQFAVFNTHFDHKGVTAREKAAELIAQRVAALDMPVVFMGDLNATPETPMYNTIAATLADTSDIALDTMSGGTFNAWVGREDGLPIDYIFVTPDSFHVFEYFIDKEKSAESFPSDHYAIVARMRFR
ncbi:MAG: endonuclease/exonuclease/phosphatase family protein [Oscillospiraceae bacterium]|nr:endonuclease/exonuclease/phosphatase family protein [Oscillospiraceae bacterium]